ncbi:GNAT family N-acetyltransferase [Cellulomonas sp. APG4]|uniref:GNAT family N-acetyltransferase n=1 Tax=Cellulomonas sp. APG4 TaxID=1538656 RepID=UPI00137A44EA|nr:GNAT family N-acetyltransferase [Cellulomonas sp. APG4]
MDIRLRPWRTSDAAALLDALTADPELDKQLGGAGLDGAAGAVAFIERELQPATLPVEPGGNGTHHLAVTVDGRAVGSIGLSHIERRHDTAWVSYWLGPEHRGLGLAARSLATVATWAFDEVGLFRLELAHRVNNPASCRVATRAGFTAEGVERKKLRYGSERFDVETHARLRSDAAPGLAPLELDRGRCVAR